MKTNKNMLRVSILFFVFACVFSVVIFKEATLAPKIAFFALGFGSGVSFGQWKAGQKKD